MLHAAFRWLYQCHIYQCEMLNSQQYSRIGCCVSSLQSILWMSVLYGNNINFNDAKTSQGATEGSNIFKRSWKPGKDSKRTRIRIKIINVKSIHESWEQTWGIGEVEREVRGHQWVDVCWSTAITLIKPSLKTPIDIRKPTAHPRSQQKCENTSSSQYFNRWIQR